MAISRWAQLIMDIQGTSEFRHLNKMSDRNWLWVWCGNPQENASDLVDDAGSAFELLFYDRWQIEKVKENALGINEINMR